MVDAGIRDILIVTEGRMPGTFCALGNGRELGLNYINYATKAKEAQAALSWRSFSDRN
jgi:dTDP-glucose pyrophosphorylase